MEDYKTKHFQEDSLRVYSLTNANGRKRDETEVDEVLSNMLKHIRE